MKILRLLILIPLLSGCSKRGYFAIFNLKSHSIIVTYEFESVNEACQLFDGQPQLYQANQNGTPNWQKQLPVNDLDSTSNRVEVIVPANASFIFGTLRNDDYQGANKPSKAGCIFNLKSLTVQGNQNQLNIPKDDFDQFFKEKNGFVYLKLSP